MNEVEMMEALAPISDEFHDFKLKDSSRGAWLTRFGHHSKDTFYRICSHVLDNCKFTPRRADFAKAETEILGTLFAQRKAYEPSKERLEAYDRMMYDRGLVKYVTRPGSTPRSRVTAYLPLFKMGVIQEAFGYQWINKQLGMTDAKACMDLTGKVATSNSPECHRYMKWKQEAFKAAWKKLHGAEPDIKTLAQYR